MLGSFRSLFKLATLAAGRLLVLGLALFVNSCGGAADAGTAPVVATGLAVTAAPSNSPQDRIAFPAQPVVQLLDVNGSAAALAGTVITASITAGGGTLNGSTTATTSSTGAATFTNLSVAGTIGARTLTFSANGLTSATATLTLAPGAATTIAAGAGNTQSAIAGAAVTTPPAVAVTDADGNVVSGTAVTFAVASGSGSLTGASQTTNASGTATVGSWTLGTTAGTDTLTATSAGLSGSPLTFTATGTAGPATKLVVTAPPSSTAVDRVAIVAQPRVQLQDANGNASLTAGTVITASISSGGGTLGGTTTASTASTGAATFTNLSISGTVGARTLSFAASGLSNATAAVTVTPGAATGIGVNAGNTQTAVAGAALATAPAVKVNDADGNGVSGIAVTFAIASGGGSVGGGSQTTNASGIATVGSWTLGTTAGANTLVATSTGLTGSPVTFTATGSGGPVASVRISPVSGAVSIGQSLQMSATAQDAFGNPLSGRTVTWSTVNNDVATISSSGLASAVAFGVATISATIEGHSASAMLSVPPPANLLTVSGMVYERVDSVPYDVGQFSNPTIPAAQVTLEANAGTTNSSGAFLFPLGQPLSLSYHSFTAAAAGYEPVTLPVFPQGNGSQSVNVGQYKPPVVTPRPGFLRGVVAFDAGGWVPTVLTEGLFPPTYSRIKTTVGAGLVANVDPFFLIAMDLTANTVVMDSLIPGGAWGMLTESALAPLVADAHAKGLQYMMSLDAQILVANSNSIYAIPSSQTAFWDAWFTAYTPLVVGRATIARDLGVEYLNIGQNFGYVTQLSVERWKKVIAAIRATGYTGKLVTFGGTDPTGSHNSDMEHYNTTEGNNNPGAFMALFDFIGLNIYDVIPALAPSQTRQSLRAGISSILSAAVSAPVPLLVTLATPSVHTGATNNEYIEPVLGGGSVAPARTLDMMQQSDVYEALFEVVNGTPTGSGRVAGILTWGYWYLDTFQTFSTPGDVAFDKSANIRGKPAESVMSWWFQQWR
jgi:Bacterial Ig-like domain (group 2)